jgi:hypothetical protein
MGRRHLGTDHGEALGWPRNTFQGKEAFFHAAQLSLLLPLSLSALMGNSTIRIWPKPLKAISRPSSVLAIEVLCPVSFAEEK